MSNTLPSDYPIHPDRPLPHPEMIALQKAGALVLKGKLPDTVTFTEMDAGDITPRLQGVGNTEVIVHKGFDLWTRGGAEFVWSKDHKTLKDLEARKTAAKEVMSNLSDAEEIW